MSQVSNPSADISLVSKNYGIEAKKYGAQVSNPAANIILVSENYGIESKKDGATETLLWDKGVKYPPSAVVGIRDHTTLKYLHR